MTLTLDSQGQIFDSHVLGMGRSIDLEWSRHKLDTMMDAQWACSWATVHGKYIGQVMWNCYSFQPVGPCMDCPFSDLGAEGCCRSLNALLTIIVVVTWHAGKVTTCRCYVVNDILNGDLMTQGSGPRFNIKTVLSTYGDFHVKDKTAVRTSYL